MLCHSTVRRSKCDGRCLPYPLAAGGFPVPSPCWKPIGITQEINIMHHEINNHYPTHLDVKRFYSWGSDLNGKANILNKDHILVFFLVVFLAAVQVLLI